MRLRILAIVAVVLLVTAFSLSAQEVIVPLIPSDGSAATMINAQIAADTVGRGFSPNRIYEFQRDQVYLQNATLTVLAGQTIRFRASEGSGAKPVLYLWPTGTGTNPQRPPGWSITLNASNAEVEGICMVGIYEWDPVAINNIQGGLIQTSGAGGTIVLDDVILSNTNGNHVRTNFSTKKVQATDCIFANMGSLSTSNFGAGKAFDLRDTSCDSLIIVNNTFVNYQDRPIRHYNGTNATGAIKYGRVDHNTFVNGMGFHGLLSLGSVGREMIITNNLFIDAFALGEDSTDATRAAEWANTGEVYANGNNKITWIFTQPNDTTKWKVSNNYWTIGDSGKAFLQDFGFGTANPLSAHIISRLGSAAAKAFTQVDLKPVNVPRLMTNLMRWYEWPNPLGAGKKKEQTYYVRDRDDFDRRFVEYFRDTLNVSYPTDAAAYIGGERGLPVGDLNWFKDKKEIWKQGMPQAIAINIVKDDLNNDFVPDSKGQTVTVQGVITTPNYRITGGSQYYMQDATGGINIFSSSVTAALNIGDVVNITGKVDHYRGLTELVPQKIDDVIVVNTGAAVDPLRIFKSDLNEFSEGMLVRIYGYAIVDPAKWPVASKDGTVKFTNGVDTVDVFIDKDLGMSGTQPPQGLVDIVGAAEQFTTKVPPDNGYEIRPRGLGDFLTSTGIAGRDASLPTEFALHQNYPNPFNPSTTIDFDVPQAGQFKVVVYDLLGKMVATLYDGKLAPGFHKFHFSGVELPSGVYFYRVEGKQYLQAKKMMLIK